MIVVPGSISMHLGVPTVPADQIPAMIRSIESYYTRDPHDECGPIPCTLFYPISGSEISRYAIYRSFIGFEAVIPTLADIVGKTLELAINLGATQVITFDDTKDIATQLTDFFVGGSAVVSKVHPTRILFRIDEGSSPGVLQIIGGTAMTDFGINAGTISEKSQSHVIAYINAKPEDSIQGVEYCDIDGSVYDFYKVATINHANEISAPTEYVSPSESTGKLCWVYGLVSSPSGVRVPDAEISIRILEYPQSVVAPSFINDEIVTIYSGPNGRFEAPVLQGALVDISIPSIYFNRKVRIPLKNRAPLIELPVDRDYRPDKNLP